MPTTISLTQVKPAAAPQAAGCRQPTIVEDIPALQAGYLLYEGPSRVDGKPIVAIATGFKKSGNIKTGNMLQIWILRADISPIEATFKGEDVSVCGNCKHRPNSPTNPAGMGTCYVNIGQGPSAVWNAYKRGSYRMATPGDWQHFKGRRIRLGAYGDPGMLPFDLVEKIVGVSDRHTAYTHTWKYNSEQRFREFMMASCDTPEEMVRAQQKGWRTFRVRMADEPLQANERMCPASEEAGKKVTCMQCTACHGGGNAKASIAIIAHGTDWKPKRFMKVRRLQKAHKAFRHLLKQSAYALSRRGVHRKRNRRIEKLNRAARAGK